MDFFQVYKYIAFSVSTGTPTPEAHLQFLTDDICRVKVNWFSSLGQLGGAIKWPGDLSIDNDGKIQLKLYKVKEENWTVPFKPIMPDERLEIPKFWTVSVVAKQQLNYDTCLLTVNHCDRVFNYIGVGRHVSIHQEIDGKMRIYQYTPVPLLPLKSIDEPNPKPGSWFSTKQDIYFLVKSYDKGTLSKWLCQRKVGENITISNPQGTFNIAQVKNTTEFYLLAGGTGITPILSLAIWAIQSKENAKIKIFFFNRHEKNIVWEKEMNDLSKIYPGFSIEHILSRPSEKWTGRKGRIDLEMLKELVPKYEPGKSNNVFFGICGQMVFTTSIAVNLEKELGYPKEQVYRYLGQ